MSTFMLSGRGGIENWRFSTKISLYFEKHPGYQLGYTGIDVNELLSYLKYVYRVLFMI